MGEGRVGGGGQSSDRPAPTAKKNPRGNTAVFMHYLRSEINRQHKLLRVDKCINV